MNAANAANDKPARSVAAHILVIDDDPDLLRLLTLRLLKHFR